MKILSLTNEPDLPEAHLLAGIAAAGHSLTVVCSPASKLLPVFQSSATIEHLQFRSRFDFAATKKLRAIIDATKPDIIHSFHARGLTAALLATRHARLIAHVAYRGTCGHISRWDPSAYFSFLHPRLTMISCVSDAVRLSLRGIGIPERKLTTIYKGHELSWYNSAPPSRSELSIPEDACTIGFVGNMRPVKGADILIRAFELLADLPQAHLVLIGEVRDPTTRAVLEASPARSRIHALGFRANASAIVGSCDIFSLPSRDREGFPKAIIEAMARGVAPVVSDAGGIPEIVQNGQSGLVVPAGSVEALATGLRQLVLNKTERLQFGAASKERIRNHFRISDTIKKTLAMYESITSAQKSAEQPRA